MAIAIGDITGLILAGGRGSRMGSLDKGLQRWRGQPLVEHALRRLAPQVGAIVISANRHLDRYSRYGHPVVPDVIADYPGPLAGIQAGLRACRTAYLAVVPCDSPDLPLDLVARLAAAFDGDIDGDLEVTLARSGERTYPVCCLMSSTLNEEVSAALARGERAVGRWIASRRHRDVSFDDATLFRNLNDLADLDEGGSSV